MTSVRESVRLCGKIIDINNFSFPSQRAIGEKKKNFTSVYFWQSSRDERFEALKKKKKKKTFFILITCEIKFYLIDSRWERVSTIICVKNSFIQRRGTILNEYVEPLVTTRSLYHCWILSIYFRRFFLTAFL